MSYFPVIDLSSLNGRGGYQLVSVGEQICDAAQRYGFFYVKGHGIEASVIDSVFETAQKFFALPHESKNEVAVSDSHRGFLGIGASTMEGYRKADLKESYIWGLDIDPGSSEADDAAKFAGCKSLAGIPAEHERRTERILFGNSRVRA